MKTSIDLPDDLYRRVKARSALEGRAVREVATELFRAWVDRDPDADGPYAPAPAAAEPLETRAGEGGQATWLSAWSALGARVDAPGLVSQLQQDRR